jgi:uncharacterized protein (DUF488 family)
VSEASPLEEPGTSTTVWTIGHSTRSTEELLALLREHGLSQLVDIRSIPASRRNPQFGRDALSESLEEAGIRYAWMGDTLGGLRKPSPATRHTALRVDGFRGYADHMETAEFRAGVDALLALARDGHTTVMCAEAVWWRCHRSMLSDYLTLVRGVRVFHAIDASPSKPHAPRAEARLVGDRLVYDMTVPRTRSRPATKEGGGAPLFEGGAPTREREAGTRPRRGTSRGDGASRG